MYGLSLHRPHQKRQLGN